MDEIISAPVEYAGRREIRVFILCHGKIVWETSGMLSAGVSIRRSYVILGDVPSLSARSPYY
jgi:hypothetical protein